MMEPTYKAVGSGALANGASEHALQIRGNDQGGQRRTSGEIHAELHGEDAFRVMYLKAGVADDELQVHLENVSHQYLPTYEAISYAWGDATRKEQLGLLPLDTSSTISW